MSETKYQSVSGGNLEDIEIEKLPGENKATKTCVIITAVIVAITILCALLFVEPFDTGGDVAPVDSSSSSSTNPLIIASSSSSSFPDIISSSSSSSSSPWEPAGDVLYQHALSDETAVCNDGTPAYFYYRPSPIGEKRWVIYMEGSQTYCFDDFSCEDRWNVSGQYMTSNDYEATKEWSGIVSNNETINPDWYNANHIAIPSCTSDLYGGNATLAENAAKGLHWSFLGYRQVHTVILDILDLYGFATAEDVIVTGNGGGGVGTLIHIDHIKTMLEDNGFHGTIKGVPDTSLMLDYYPRWSTDGCTTATACPVNTSLILAQEYWNSVSPERCLGDGWEPWQCYVGQYTLKTILTPIMPFQWLYEKSQLTLLGVPGRPSSHDGSLDYANDVADFYLTSFEEEFANMPQNGWFAPACFKHENVMDETWDQVGLNNTQGNIVRLSEAIRDFWAGNNVPRLSDSCRELDCNPEC